MRKLRRSRFLVAATKAIGRRRLLLAIGAASLWSPARLLAQQQQRVYRIGFLIPPREAGGRPHLDAFREGLREFGYVEGKNVTIDVRFGEDDLARLPGLAADLVRQNPDVIVTGSPPGVRAVMEATRTIPIVIGAVYDPVGQGFVASLGRPGGNVTGLSVQYEDTIPKLLELIRAVVPSTTKIAVLRTVDPSHDNFLTRIAALARPMQIQIAPIGANSPAELERAFARISEAQSEALIVLPHPLFNTRPDVVVGLAAARRVPAIYPFRSYAEAGGLISFGISIPESFRRAAYYVNRILNGAKPADLPVEQPTKIDLVVNLKTAKDLRITIPQSVLLRADDVIQ